MAWTPIAPWRLGAVQKLAVSGTAAASSAFSANTHAVMIVATTDCHIRFGVAPVAVAADTLIRSAFPPLVFKVAPGDEISVIQDSASGSLYVTELTH